MRSLGRYAPALALMGLIFLLSAQTSLPQVESELDIVVRKVAHMVEFGLLWWLWVRALRPASDPRRTVLVALAITLAYAVSDELHQHFVAGRHASPFDVAIDAAGIGVAVALWLPRATRARWP